jgi:hypothetical protein
MASGEAVAALPYPPDAPDHVHAAAARCRRVAALLGRLADDVAHDRSLLHGCWVGSAATACEAEMSAATRLVRALAEPLHRSGGFLDGHAQVVAQARSRVAALRLEYDDVAAAHRRRVDRLLADTDLAGPMRRIALQEAQDQRSSQLAALRRRHEAELERVAEHARVTARRLRHAAASVLPARRSGGRPAGDHEGSLAGRLPLLAAMRAAAGAGGAPPPAGSAPELVLAWWAALTPDEQERMIARYPSQVGALDGLPGAVRTQANEQQLATDLAVLRAKNALSDDEQRWLRSSDLVQQQLDRVRSDEDPFSLERLTAQLLVYEPTAFGYEGRAAIVVGDVDTADNVAFLVPGLNSTVDTAMSSLTSNALRVTQDARRLSPYETTATVAWMGYDAPELGNVVSDDAAVDGSRLLLDDVLAVQASRVVQPHLTVVGHSYGSTTTGTMLRDHESGTDDVVLIGSPGPNVEDADALRVPDGHVFVGASSRDPVSFLDRFGKDPTHESFGATRFEAEDPTRNSWRLDLDDHSKYYNEGTESLSNIVHVVTGDYDGVVRAPYRHEVWLLPDGINSDPESDRDPTTVR